MSYILDALRRADAERERGAVPGLHAKPEPLADGDDDVASSRYKHGLVGVAIALLLGLALTAWHFMGRDATEPGAPAVALPSSPAAAVAISPLPEDKPVQPLPEPVAPMAPVVTPAPTPTARFEPPQAPVRKAASKVPARDVPASAAAETPVYALSELPETVRRSLPALTVGGAMYAEHAANRMLILNGQVFHEGDAVSAGLTLERIKLKSAVLAYKGYRYSISY